MKNQETLMRIYEKISRIKIDQKERKELKRQENLKTLKEIGEKLRKDREDYEALKLKAALKTTLKSVRNKASKSYSGTYKLYTGHQLNK